MDKNLEYEPVRGAHILMIVNPVSGRISGEHTADKLEAWLKENGAAVDRFETTETENGSGYTAKLAENDYARVVVLGGDGTLNAVLNGMLHRALRTPITYLPAGTTNDFAQTLGIQKHLLDPYKSFTETEDRLIDAGKFGDGYFSYVASFGLFTKCSYATPRTMKRLLGHFAYVLEGMKDLHALDATPLTVTADGKFFEGAYIFGAFSNSLSIGGMLKYDENSVDMNDGKLEMLLIRKPETLPDLHRLILALKTTIFRTSTSISLPRVRSACMPQRALIGQSTANTPQAASIPSSAVSRMPCASPRRVSKTVDFSCKTCIIAKAILPADWKKAGQ